LPPNCWIIYAIFVDLWFQPVISIYLLTCISCSVTLVLPEFRIIFLKIYGKYFEVFLAEIHTFFTDSMKIRATWFPDYIWFFVDIILTRNFHKFPDLHQLFIDTRVTWFQDNIPDNFPTMCWSTYLWHEFTDLLPFQSTSCHMISGLYSELLSTSFQPGIFIYFLTCISFLVTHVSLDCRVIFQKICIKCVEVLLARIYWFFYFSRGNSCDLISGLYLNFCWHHFNQGFSQIFRLVSVFQWRWCRLISG